MTSMPIHIQQLTHNEIDLLHALMTVFGDAFSDAKTYTSNRAGEDYLNSLLNTDYFIALVAQNESQVVGGLTAYELKKFECERSEIYIYDLAVALPYRRSGVATALIEELKNIAAVRGAYVIFVQADTGIEDEPAIVLYRKLGKPENILYFDIAIEHNDGAA